MYTQAGLLERTAGDANQIGLGVEQAIRLDCKLTTDQKDTLTRINRGFVERG
jgi:hypothetical protein